MMEFAIFGAQGIALGAYRALRNLYPNRKIHCFLVSKIGNNTSVLEGTPVLELDEFSKILLQDEKDKIQILIATPENMMRDIEVILEDHGFYYYAKLTSLRWTQMMSYYYMCGNEFMPLSALPIGCHRQNICIFMAKFYKDKPLTEHYDIPNWITPVQAGAVLCRERVAECLDCNGRNISSKNGNYSELTVLYWIWKNYLSGENPEDKYNELMDEKNEYYGLCHYRRILELSEDDILRLEDNDIDLVLPFPMPYEPNIEEHHKRYLTDMDWKALLTALKELQPGYAAAFPTILKQQYLYNYNIILARKNVLAEYCKWLFPILERVEQLSKPRGWERQDRYIGYMGETLETLYFMVNKNKLNIVYTGCKFLL